MFNLHSVRSLMFALVVLSVVVLGMPTTSSAGVIFSVSFGPPPLPVYEQPLCPGEGFIWTPGYWAYDYDFGDYYWVPGTWVRAPRVGYYWTPGYWAWGGNRYVFYDGYWGPQVGFYGGIDYGYGYFGNGYEGGRWDRGRFFYNRSVTNVNVTTIHNVYNTTVINRNNNRVSFNGGNGGVSARPTRQQESFARQRHLAPVADQTQHRQLARVDREQRASVNHGRPAIAATPRARDFKDRVPAKEAGGAYNPPANRAPSDQRGNRREAQRQENNQQANRPGQRAESQQRVQEQRQQKNDRPPSAQSRDIQRGERSAPVNTGDARREQQNQREQQRVNQRQEQERQRVQQNQERQSQRVEQQRANDSRRPQAEQQQQHQQRVEQKREQPPQQQRAEPRREQPPQQRAEPKREQPQQRQQPANRDESKEKKDRPPNER